MRHLTPAILALALPVLLTACSDPLRDVERLSDMDLPPETLTAAAIPPPEEQVDGPGLLSRILDGTLTRGPELPAAETAAETLAEGPEDGLIVAEALDAETIPALELVSAMDPVEVPSTEAPQLDEPALADGIEGEMPQAGAAPEEPIPGTDAIEGDTEMAAASAPEPAQPRRRGLFGLLNVASAAAPPVSDGPDFAHIAPGTTLIYGQIATVCGLSGSQLGSPIGQASGYTIYDTNPGSTEQRTHYIMGFGDGCARQFRAALALFGDVGTHELVRYAQGAGDLPYSETDSAYEEIKGRVCRVPAGQPCGDALDRLAARTTFVTAYANFESNPQWAEILLSGGQVVAMGFEG